MSPHPPPGQFSLLRQRRFAPFFWTQFLGAFNDNVFKTALLTILTYETLSWTTLDPNLLNNLIPGLFILPFLLFSATAGQLADKFDKARLARLVKLLEIAIMAVAAVGWFNHNLWLLIAAVAGMGMHSALFGPVKYAYLPQHLQPRELVGGNGIVEMGTFVGILLGEVLGAVLILTQPWGVELVAACTIAIAFAGWLASRRIPPSPAPMPGLRISWNPVAESVRNIGCSSGNRPVFLAMLGNSWFWFYGAIILAQFPVFSKNELQGDHGVFVLLLTAFSIGIGAGSLLCERLSGRKLEIGLVPLGAIGLTLSGIGLYLSGSAYAAAAAGSGAVDALGFLARPWGWHVVSACILIGVSGGIYIVPLFALVQTLSDRTRLSRTIAGMNILNALFMVVAALIASFLLKQGLTIPQLFLTTALLNAVVTAAIFMFAPEYLVRFSGWVLMHTLRRVRIVDGDCIPEQGAALLVCGHASRIDALVIASAIRRPIRVASGRGVSRLSLRSLLFRGTSEIPMAAPGADTVFTQRAIDDIALALHNHELVCLFGKSAATGADVFAQSGNGIARILDRAPVSVVPLSIRCRSSGWNPFRKLEIVVGKPLTPAEAASGRLPAD